MQILPASVLFPPAQRHRILIVDDEQDTLDTTKVMLEDYYDVVLAQSAAQARAILETQKFSALLVDNHMPGEKGLKLLDWLAQSHSWHHIYLVTGDHNFQRASSRDENFPGANVVTKPYSANDLLERFGAEWDRHRILVVDPDQNNLETAQRTYEPYYDVVTALSAAEAQRGHNEQEISITIVASDLPDGLGFAEHLKGTMDATRIILASHDKVTSSQFVVIEKPFEPATLLAQVAQCLSELSRKAAEA